MKNRMFKLMTLLTVSALTFGAVVPVIAAETAETVVEETAVTDEGEEVTEEVADDTAEDADAETDAEGETKDRKTHPVVGEWTGVSKGVEVSFEFDNEGMYVAEFAGAKVAEGTWNIEENTKMILDMGTPDEMVMEYDEAAESMKVMLGDEECVFAKEAEDVEEEETVALTMKAFMDRVLGTGEVLDGTAEDDGVVEDEVTEEAAENAEDVADDVAETEETDAEDTEAEDTEADDTDEAAEEDDAE